MPNTSSPRMRSLAGLCLLALPLSMPSLAQAGPLAALRGTGVPASVRSGNLEVSPARIDESLPQAHSVGKVITLTNHGESPMPISIETWVKAPGAGADSVGPRVSICIFSTMLDDGIDNSFSWLLKSLPKVSGVDIRSGRYSTPSLDELLRYDMLVVTSYNSWADPDSAGNLLADYVDRGGTLVLMHRALDTTPLAAFALKGRIVGPAYSPVAPSPFYEGITQIDTRNFIDDPLVQSVRWMQTWTAQRAELQGKGVALGYNVMDGVAAAYNPDLPVFYINLTPYEPDYIGGPDLGQLFLNFIDRMQGTYNWLKNPVPNNAEAFTLAPGESRRMILPVGHNYALPLGTHYGQVFIYSNWPQQVTLPATLRVRAR